MLFITPRLSITARIRLVMQTSDSARQTIFTDIYRHNRWGSDESVSGPGSTVARTAAFRAQMQALFDDLRIASLLDAPCGDFNWLKEMPLTNIRYFGIDIVVELIASNQSRYGQSRYGAPIREFHCFDFTHDALPTTDLILCRDALVHLTLAEIARALRNFQRSGARWLLTTSFTAHPENHEMQTGGWRALNLQKPPFDFPAPWQIIEEKCLHSGGIYADKILGLWALPELPLAND